jgi:hypothetical protein
LKVQPKATAFDWLDPVVDPALVVPAVEVPVVLPALVPPVVEPPLVVPLVVPLVAKGFSQTWVIWLHSELQQLKYSMQGCPSAMQQALVTPSTLQMVPVQQAG